MKYIHPSYSSLIAKHGDTEELYSAFRAIIQVINQISPREGLNC